LDEDSKIQKSTGKRLPPNAGKGRRKGSLNKVSGEIRAMIVQALSAAGGTAYLVEQAEKSPQAFLSLLGKLVPAEVRAELGGSLTVETSFDAIMERAIVIRGGLPDWENRLKVEIGDLFLKHARGEPLPEPLIVGGLESDVSEH
jgi:hypothetical protein